jgi:hypothetical protein
MITVSDVLRIYNEVLEEIEKATNREDKLTIMSRLFRLGFAMGINQVNKEFIETSWLQQVKKIEETDFR